ncbi:MAG: prepilin-type N-terminal cleavage/methylation domain-containing protein [Muribaculum sp.]|nr:prepilin-type N-terminal cleavage/methylation domain-containing protein [Muribaculum sp.]
MDETDVRRKPQAGFSLIELVVVITIIAAITAILAPQYLQYVQKSKISVDLNNAEAIANAVSADIADGSIPLENAGSTREVTASDISNVTAFPVSKVDPSYDWKVIVDDVGLCQVTLGGCEIWPDPDGTNGYRTMNN